jgi:putative hemolysin
LAAQRLRAQAPNFANFRSIERGLLLIFLPTFLFIFMWIAVAIVCTLIESVFTALEVAMNAASRTRLRSLAGEEANAATHSNPDESSAPKMKADRASQVLVLLESPKRLALMFLTVTSLTMWTAAASLVWFARLEDWDLPLLILALGLVLFCAEVLPLLIAARHPERVAMRGVRWVGGALRVLEPLIALLKGTGNLGARGLGAQQNASSGVTPSELRTALATAEEEGVIESDERALLEGAMDFREKQAHDVMTPAREIVSVRDTSSLRSSRSFIRLAR